MICLKSKKTYQEVSQTGTLEPVLVKCAKAQSTRYDDWKRVPYLNCPMMTSNMLEAQTTFAVALLASLIFLHFQLSGTPNPVCSTNLIMTQESTAFDQRRHPSNLRLTYILQKWMRRCQMKSIGEPCFRLVPKLLQVESWIGSWKITRCFTATEPQFCVFCTCDVSVLNCWMGLKRLPHLWEPWERTQILWAPKLAYHYVASWYVHWPESSKSVEFTNWNSIGLLRAGTFRNSCRDAEGLSDPSLDHQ